MCLALQALVTPIPQERRPFWTPSSFHMHSKTFCSHSFLFRVIFYHFCQGGLVLGCDMLNDLHNSGCRGCTTSHVGPAYGRRPRPSAGGRRSNKPRGVGRPRLRMKPTRCRSRLKTIGAVYELRCDQLVCILTRSIVINIYIYISIYLFICVPIWM